MAIFHGNAIPSASGDFDIPYSCRFNIGDSPRLTRTPSGAGNQKTWTISFWMKKTSINSGSMFVFSANATTEINWASGSKEFGAQFSGGNFSTGHLQRDFSAWYHVVWAMDTTQGTDTNRMKFYINGDAISFTPSAWPALNSDQAVNGTGAHSIGCRSTNADFFDGYIAEFHLVDGTALDADSFGELNDFGGWSAIKYTGSHGTNGFYLDFADSGDLGDDESTNTNDFTETNLSTYDQMLDSPTNNFSTLNPIASGNNDTLTEGSLKKTGASAQNRAMSTIGFDSGKWYFEVLIETFGSANPAVGVVTTVTGNHRNELHTGADAGGFGYYPGGINHNTATNGGTYASYTAGDIIGVACDMDNLKVYFYKNGVNAISGTAYETLLPNTTYAFAHSTNGSGVQIANFGQDATFAGNKSPSPIYDDGEYGAFHYEPRTDHKALCTKNIPDCAVIPSEHFGIMLTDSGAGARTFASHGVPAGARFAPEMVWFKARGQGSTDGTHRLCDVILGVQIALTPNLGAVSDNDGSAGLTSFDADGFTVGSDVRYCHTAGDGMVIWNWKLGGTPTADNVEAALATPTAGSVKIDGVNKPDALAGDIPVTRLTVNTAAGMSLGFFDGTGANDVTVAHGLTKAPELVVFKNQDDGDNWIVGTLLGGTNRPPNKDFTDYGRRENTVAWSDHAAFWADTNPDATTINLGNQGGVNGVFIHRFEAYHSVEGYSKIGSYAGNGNADGTFAYCGFRPYYVVIKRIDGSSDWRAWDTACNPYNISMAHIKLSDNHVENTSIGIDILSNGFKVRSSDSEHNTSSAQYLFYAIAETPFKNANAR